MTFWAHCTQYQVDRDISHTSFAFPDGFPGRRKVSWLNAKKVLLHFQLCFKWFPAQQLRPTQPEKHWNGKKIWRGSRRAADIAVRFGVARKIVFNVKRLYEEAGEVKKRSASSSSNQSGWRTSSKVSRPKWRHEDMRIAGALLVPQHRHGTRSRDNSKTNLFLMKSKVCVSCCDPPGIYIYNSFVDLALNRFIVLAKKKPKFDAKLQLAWLQCAIYFLGLPYRSLIPFSRCHPRTR